MSSSEYFVALEPDIISACAEHERENGHKREYRRCLPIGSYFIKFDAYSSFLPEVTTLKYLADLAKNDASAPRVPQVHHFFHRNGRMAYVVMELIQLVEVPTADLAVKAAQAVLWMRGVPAPSDVVLGPKGPGRARHVVFKNRVAPLDFVSVKALERYFNKAIEKLRLRFKNIADVSIANEQLVLTQSDMDPSNFGVDAAGQSVILDPGEIGWLPESLALYMLFRTTDFARDVTACLYAPEDAAHLGAHPNLASMGGVRVMLAQAAGPNLNNNGQERSGKYDC
ncbi:hypothetical protein M407DRAFT_23270 [Tulasnella calospora MUT 4182]|uniref:Aminoglycoside phosphotransferase domain-containing protein n=1 Tax=Tulasnella calospora MUT 4182 TaxID=1051891 RepID=A0A0C3QJU3_9AGAM|nr:hypothetical protein M407DRAFT_23270 [Tulasnella calospora MUT 4182]